MTQAQDMVAELLICGQFQSFLKVRFLGDKICFEGTGLKRGLGVSWLFFFFPLFLAVVRDNLQNHKGNKPSKFRLVTT